MAKSKHRVKHKEQLQKYRDEINEARKLGYEIELKEKLEALQRSAIEIEA